MAIKVQLKRGRILVGDQETSLLSGAIHYWRLNPNSWEKILNSIRDMGLETIETYIPWEFHEIEKDVFDFKGETDSRRDLVGFLELTKEMGFWLIARPGPYIYAEWVNMGVPTDVAAYHRLHEYFISRAQNYLRAVCEVLVPFQASQGGHITMLQADNESDPFEYCYEEQLGLGKQPGMFHEYLRAKYDSIDELNQRWDSSYSSFENAKAVMSPVELTPEYNVRYLDFIHFRADYINKCVDFYAKELRRNGIDVPMLHNTYDIFSVQDFEGLNEVVDLVGVDAYPSDQFEPSAAATGDIIISYRRLQDAFRYLRTFSETAYIAEYESGIGHGLHYYTGVLFPNQYTLMFMAAVQAGIHAWNWFMLVHRDNWMMCPINEWGRKNRELFRIFSENVQMYERMKVPDLEKMTNTSALFYLDHQVFDDSHNDLTLAAIYESGIDFEYYNLETGHVKKPLLFYAGSNWMPIEYQEKLAAYVEEGGHLVFFNTQLLYDENWKKANPLNLVLPQGVTNKPFLDHLATETEVDLGGYKTRTRAPFFVYDGGTPGVPIYGTRVDADIRDTDLEENQYLRSLVIGRRYQVGYREQRGKGSITVVGVHPTASLVKAIHHYLGVPINIDSRHKGIKSAIFRRDDVYYAVLVNLENLPVQTMLDIAPDLLSDGDYKAVSLRESISLDDRQLNQGRLYVEMPRKDGTVIEIRKG